MRAIVTQCNKGGARTPIAGTPLLSFSPGHRSPGHTPERVLVADHQLSPGFFGIGSSILPPRPFDRDPAFLDELLRVASLILERYHPLG